MALRDLTNFTVAIRARCWIRNYNANDSNSFRRAFFRAELKASLQTPRERYLSNEDKSMQAGSGGKWI